MLKLRAVKENKRGWGDNKKQCYGHFDCAVLVANCTDFSLFFD